MLTIDFLNPIPIYTEINFNNKTIPFNLLPAERFNVFNSLKCERIDFIPHGHVTHLETKDHLKQENITESLPLNLSRPLLTQVIDPESEFTIREDVEFVIIKKMEPKMNEFRGVDAAVIGKISESNVKVIGINEPSFDPENDNGKLLAHKIAFANGIYLVEMLDIPIKVEINEFYYCLMNIFRFSKTDAYPCSPILYPMK